MHGRDGGSQLLQLITLELDQAIALFTMQMVVLGITVVVLVDSTPLEVHAPQNPSVDELFKRPINGRSTYAMPVLVTTQLVDQVIRIEVLMTLKDRIEEHLLLLRQPFSTTLQKLGKTLAG